MRGSLNIVPVESNPDLVRDMKSHAVLNVDQTGLRKYKDTRKKLLTQKKEHEDTKARLLNLEVEMTQLRSIINDLAHMKGK